MIQRCGRYLMNANEIRLEMWTKTKNWTRDPNDPDYLILNFKPCSERVFIEKCAPCGHKSAMGYYCNLKKSWISVSFCNNCTDAVVPLGVITDVAPTRPVGNPEGTSG